MAPFLAFLSSSVRLTVELPGFLLLSLAPNPPPNPPLLPPPNPPLFPPNPPAGLSL